MLKQAVHNTSVKSNICSLRNPNKNIKKQKTFKLLHVQELSAIFL